MAYSAVGDRTRKQLIWKTAHLNAAATMSPCMKSRWDSTVFHVNLSSGHAQLYTGESACYIEVVGGKLDFPTSLALAHQRLDAMYANDSALKDSAFHN